MREVSHESYLIARQRLLGDTVRVGGTDFAGPDFPGDRELPAGRRMVELRDKATDERRAASVRLKDGTWRYFLADDLPAMTQAEVDAKTDAAMKEFVEAVRRGDFGPRTADKIGERYEPKSDFAERIAAIDRKRLMRVTRGGRTATARERTRI